MEFLKCTRRYSPMGRLNTCTVQVDNKHHVANKDMGRLNTCTVDNKHHVADKDMGMHRALQCISSPSNLPRQGLPGQAAARGHCITHTRGAHVIANYVSSDDKSDFSLLGNCALFDHLSISIAT
jgi:hypothetical protein